MAIALSGLIAPVERELEKFDSIFKESLRSDVAIVDTIARYVAKQKGKRIRPLLVLLSASVSGGITDRTFHAASLVEILHTATLVHDDVVDMAETRRGFRSVNSIWKNKVAVLMGDYFLARGLLLSLDHDEYGFLKVISNTVRRMSEGELLQISKTRKLNTDEETYFRIIGDKTASLLATCTELGALSSNARQEEVDELRQFGETLGLAFQIRDDVLDFIGKSTVLGKPVGGDLKERKLTLPFIYAVHHAPKPEASKYLAQIQKGLQSNEIHPIVDFVSRYGGLDYAMNKALEYSAKAKSHLEVFPDSPFLQSLTQLVDYVVERVK